MCGGASESVSCGGGGGGGNDDDNDVDDDDFDDDHHEIHSFLRFQIPAGAEE